MSCHNADPQIRYLRIVKQVLHYLKKMIMLGIKLKNDLAGYQLEEKYRELGVGEYVNRSYASNLGAKKLITRYCFFFRRAIVT